MSKTEFENSFRFLYEHSTKQLEKIPKRKQYWLSTSIEGILNDIYLMIMELNEEIYRKHDDELSEDEVQMFKEIAIKLHDLEKPLIVLWNIEDYEMKKMVSWVKLLQKEFDVVIEKAAIKSNYKFMILDWNRIKEVEFLRNLSVLHKYIHSKVINAPRKYDSNVGNIMIKLIDDTLYLVYSANSKKPTTKKEYEKRKKCLDKAINNLYAMQRPMLSYFNLVGYNEATYNEWSKMLTDELKLLQGLRKSDKANFGDLM